MDNRPIGVFDSGLGGLTAVKELLEIMPQEDIVYFGDTGRVPYGSRSQETLIKYAAQDIHFLEEKQVKMIVIACGTISSLVGRLKSRRTFQSSTSYTPQPSPLRLLRTTNASA